MKGLKRDSGIDGVSGARAPTNLKREKIVNRNPYTKPSPKAKMGGGAKKSKSM
jgi:hypothetical protein